MLFDKKRDRFRGQDPPVPGIAQHGEDLVFTAFQRERQAAGRRSLPAFTIDVDDHAHAIEERL